MDVITQKIGFRYFTSSKFQVNKQVSAWLSSIKKIGASVVIFNANFEFAIPEDFFITAKEYGLEPVVHFTNELPIARKFNDVSLLLDVYAKWGVKSMIFGDKPNTKNAWQNAGWNYENLVDHFLDRFLPLANYARMNGVTPVLPPLQPGGDYWDTAFFELLVKGLRKRMMEKIIENLQISSYGFTFNKPLSWGQGGPQRWPLTKPYATPEGQEDQVGFNNFEWLQMIGERAAGVKLPVMMLDAGCAGLDKNQRFAGETLNAVREIYQACNNQPGTAINNPATAVVLGKGLTSVNFSLDTFLETYGNNLSNNDFEQTFLQSPTKNRESVVDQDHNKFILHYLLLPSYASGVSDAVLSKVRPLIKKLHPTVGFSISEAAHAQKVSIYPDPLLFGEEQVNELRKAGCSVEILAESGIEIATNLQ